MGLDQEFISLEEVKKKHPLIDPSRYLLALWDPIDGEVDPSLLMLCKKQQSSVVNIMFTQLLKTLNKKMRNWMSLPKREI